jgi:hypothetical protein
VKAAVCMTIIMSVRGRRNVGGVTSKVLCYCSSTYLISNIILELNIFCTHLFPSFFMKVKIFREIFLLLIHAKILVESCNVFRRVV